MFKNIILGFCISIFVCVNLSAQETWSLEKCVNHALSNNINIAQAKIGQRFAQLDEDQARHAKYPNFNAGGGMNLNLGRSVDPVTNDFVSETFFSNNFSLNSGVVLYNGGRIKNSLKQAKINNQSASFDVAQSERDMALLVANNYLNVIFAKENLKIVNSQLDLSKEQLAQLEKLIAAGTRPQNEALNLEAQIALNEQNILAAENSIATALLNLKQLLRITEDIDVVIPEGDIPLKSDPEILTVEEIYASALNTQPSIRAADLDLESAAVGVEIAESALMPSLSAGGSIGTNYSNKGIVVDGFNTVLIENDFAIDNPAIINLIGQDFITLGAEQQIPIIRDQPYFNQIRDNLFYGVGLNLNIPIYNNLINKTNIERAKLNIETTELVNAQLKDNLQTQVMQALVDARTAKFQVEASQKSYDALQAAFANTKRKYDLGAVNTYDYIDAKNQLDIAQLNLIIAKYDYIFKTKVIDFYMGHPLNLN